MCDSGKKGFLSYFKEPAVRPPCQLLLPAHGAALPQSRRPGPGSPGSEDLPPGTFPVESPCGCPGLWSCGVRAAPAARRRPTGCGSCWWAKPLGTWASDGAGRYHSSVLNLRPQDRGVGGGLSLPHSPPLGNKTLITSVPDQPGPGGGGSAFSGSSDSVLSLRCLCLGSE